MYYTYIVNVCDVFLSVQPHCKLNNSLTTVGIKPAFFAMPTWLKGPVVTESSCLEYVDIEGNQHSSEVSNQLGVVAYLQSIGVVIQRFWVRFPLWSCKLFSLCSVHAHSETSQTSYSPECITPIHFIP